MFEKLMRAAERAADGVSRREFLGRLGRGAAAAAAVLATAGGAQAAVMCGPNTTWAACKGKPVGTRCSGERGRPLTCRQTYNGACACGA